MRKALVEATPRPYTRTRPVVLPKLGAFVPSIEQILAEDARAPRKQRYTANRWDGGHVTRATDLNLLFY